MRKVGHLPLKVRHSMRKVGHLPLKVGHSMQKVGHKTKKVLHIAEKLRKSLIKRNFSVHLSDRVLNLDQQR